MKLITLTLLMAAAAQAQTLAVSEAGKGEMPAPIWRTQIGGRSTAELRVSGDAAAAMRINFAWLALPEGAEMYLYGKDASGRVVAAHGPYTGSGPLNLPEFDSQILAGTEVTVSVHGAATAVWPFGLHGAEQFAAGDVAEMKLDSIYRPAAARKWPIDFRSAYLDDTLVQFNVEDGMAVMEGDIVLGPVDEVVGGGRKGDERASFALTHNIKRWQNGVVPYLIKWDGDLTFNGPLEVKIKDAIAYWNSRFPGSVVARTAQSDYVAFRFVSGICQSSVGRIGGEQNISLDNGCSKGNIIHEIGHALGFLHEHTRYDRDQYVKIETANIIAAQLKNFAMPAVGAAVNLGAYDFGSVMHYGLMAFAIDATKNTITVLIPPQRDVVIGQRNGLSAGDEAGMKARYCNSSYFTLPMAVEVDNEGGTGQFSVIMPPYCAWQVTESLNWITITSAMSGVGTTAVKFTVTPNPFLHPRSGLIKINGRTVTIKQIPPGWEN